MKSTIRDVRETTLVLNDREVEWLSSVMENEVHGHETGYDTTMRLNFREALGGEHR